VLAALTKYDTNTGTYGYDSKYKQYDKKLSGASTRPYSGYG
jgi:hypothetical protein